MAPVPGSPGHCILQPLQSIHHDVDVIGDFTDVVDRLAGLRLGFEAEQVRKGRLRSLDL
nr:hypothetical protein [Gluconobacter cerinus]